MEIIPVARRIAQIGRVSEPRWGDDIGVEVGRSGQNGLDAMIVESLFARKGYWFA